MRQAITAVMLAGTMLTGAMLTAACHREPAQQAKAKPIQAMQIDWREGDVEDAFAEARESDKPVLLYWGANWCPPCNQMKQTLFKDPAFIAETRNFIPVHLDGDAKGAQVWGEKFGISGYPTVIILRPDRSEVTRLSGGGTAGTLADVLKLAATRTMSTEDLLVRAAEPAKLTVDDWRLLASFDFLDDPRHFKTPAKDAAFVARLGATAPDPAMRRHFELTSLMMASGGDEAKAKPDPAQQAQVRTLLPAILASYPEVKANREELGFAAPQLIATLPDAGERKALGDKLIAALDRVAGDASVPLGDRLDTVSADIELAKGPGGKGQVPAAVLAKVRQRIAMADRTARDPGMRQAVMPTAGHLLADAGDPAGGEALLRKELPHAVAPYYFMATLADMAEARKDTKAAIGWLRQAAQTADGPATRVQWAMMYSDGVMRMTPGDKAAVEQSAGMAIDALGANTAGYAQRTQQRTAAWAKSLRAWSTKYGGGDVLARLTTRMTTACAGGGCKDVLKG